MNFDPDKFLRAVAPSFDVEEGSQNVSLGHLAELTGRWTGPGMNIVALPKFGGRDPGFQVKLNATQESISFFNDVGNVPNRGNNQPDIVITGLRYQQEVTDRGTGHALHVEPGIMLNLPTNQVQTEPTVVRMGTVPHGDSFLAQGNSFAFGGAPQIGAADPTPFTLGPSGNRKNIQNSNYLSVYKNLKLPGSLTEENLLDPNSLLRQSNENLRNHGFQIIRTVVLDFNAKPVGGINGVRPNSRDEDVGGIVNIPFVVENADANGMASRFWINTVKGRGRRTFLQLQYTQTVILEFEVGGVKIKWPHISVATLTKG